MKNYLLKITAVICGVFISCTSFAQLQYAWIQKANNPGPARHRVAAAAVGNRGYMGMGHINAITDILYDDWWEYDPGTDTWTQKANYAGGPRMHPATFVINNKIYVGTGRDINVVLHQDFWRYDPGTNQWDSIAPFPGAARRGAVAFTINGLGYVGTGSYHSNFYCYNPSSDSWSPVASLPGTGRISSVACSINGKGYLSTGDDGTGPLGDMWEYDPTLDTWTAKTMCPGLPRMEAAGFALNGKFYVGTGDDMSSGTNYQDFWCYDPATDSWIQVDDFSGQARRYMGCFVIGNRAYAGMGTSGTNFNDLWEYGSLSGVEENVATTTLTVFPNPVHETATLNFSNELINATLYVTDINGKKIREMKNVKGNSILFMRENLSPGIYFISVQDENKTSRPTKIILE